MESRDTRALGLRSRQRLKVASFGRRAVLVANSAVSAPGC